mgnify:CR=1 FL=1
MDTFMNIIYWWSLIGFVILTVLYLATPSIMRYIFHTDDGDQDDDKQ